MAGSALEALLHTVGHDVSAAPRRIALFSLGNFAGYGECRGMLLDPCKLTDTICR